MRYTLDSLCFYKYNGIALRAYEAVILGSRLGIFQAKNENRFYETKNVKPLIGTVVPVSLDGHR